MKGKKKRFSVFTFMLFVLNIVAVVLLLLSYLFSFINPVSFWPSSLFGLAYPYLLVVNLIFIIIWVLYRRWLFLYSLIAILVGWNFLNRYAALNERYELNPPEDYLKIMSFNVQNLANNNVYVEKNELREKIFEFIRDEHCDIICVQELLSHGSKPELLLEELRQYAGFAQFSYVGYLENQKKRLDALVIYSKYPIIGEGKIKKDEDHNFAVYCDILRNKDTIRVFNVHLESYRFGKEDYDFISGSEAQNNTESFTEGSKKVLSKLRFAFEKRARQVKLLNEYINVSSHPVVVCGDFNDTPVSFTYFESNKYLNDAFVESGRGLGNTYSGKVPSYRIDYILYSDEFTSYNYQTYRVNLSDHYPVSCYLKLED